MAVTTRANVTGSVAKLKSAQRPDTSILDTALEEAFAQTQEQVHILTGALKNSGRITKRGTNGVQWQGTISYGGASLTDEGQPHDVYYAETERDRGGEHDFLAVPGIIDFEENFRAVLRGL